MFKKKTPFFLLILLIFSIQVFVSYRILQRSQVNRIFDESNRILIGWDIHTLLFHNPRACLAEKLDYLFSLDKSQGHPHFFEFAEAACFEILDAAGVGSMEDLMILFVNAAFLLALLLSVYGIGSLIHSRQAGFLAALVVSAFPFIFSHSRVAMLDFPLTSLITLSFFLLLKTDRFASFLYSVLTGVAFGLAQITKETAVIFILPPLIYYSVKSCVTQAGRKKNLFNLLAALALFALIGATPYLRNLHVFKRYLYVTCQMGTGVTYYLEKTADLAGPLLLPLLLPLCLLYLFNFRRRKKFFFFWFIIPLILFQLSPHRHLRFIFPLMPAFALIAAQEIFSNDRLKKIRKACVFFLVFFSVLQYVLFNCGIVKYLPGEYSIVRGIPAIQKDNYAPVASAIFAVFKNEKTSGTGEKVVIPTFVGETFCPFAYKFQLSRMPFAVYYTLDLSDEREFSSDEMNCLQADYLIDKPDGQQWLEDDDRVAERQKRLKACLAENKASFKVIGEVPTPDGATIYIYKNIKRQCST